MRFLCKYVMPPVIVLGALSFQWGRNPAVSFFFGTALLVMVLTVAYYLLDRDPVRWGEAYLKQGRYAEARREFALGLEKRDVAAGMALGLMHLRGDGCRRDSREAARVFARVVDLIEIFLTGMHAYNRPSIFAALFTGGSQSVLDGNNSDQVNLRRLRDMLCLLEREGDMADDATRALATRIRDLVRRRVEKDRAR